MVIEIGVAVVLVIGAMSIWKKDKAAIEAEIAKIEADIKAEIAKIKG